MKRSFLIVTTAIKKYLDVNIKLEIIGGARGVIVIVVGNGHGGSSSNPGRDWLHFT